MTTKTKHAYRCLPAALAFAALSLPACVVGPPPGTVYASYAPPAAEIEVAGVAPGPDFVWIAGHHTWSGTAYVWSPGRYERRPHANARWVGGAWVHHSRGWYWREGRWK
jgi:hypothetical protein